MDATVARLEAQGWRAIKTTELEVEQGRLPAAPLYLNMCQGSLAAEQLMPLESDGAVVVNRPSSALNCHRYRLVKRLGDSTLSFPRTLILASSAPLSPEQVDAFYPDDRKVWIKRGDVAFPEPDRPVLIDFNDWPSFAPFRDEAARAIADYVTHRFAHRKHA